MASERTNLRAKSFDRLLTALALAAGLIFAIYGAVTADLALVALGVACLACARASAEAPASGKERA